MIPISVHQAAEAVGARRAGSASDRRIERVVTDSRMVRPGDLFVAIRGTRCDGHRFVDQANVSGATACLVDEAGSPHHAGTDRCLLVVDDTVAALGRLAGYYRRHVMPAHTTVVAVTGSNGKTTTKQMLHHVLSVTRAGQASPRSFNNEIGVPLTLLAADADDEYLIAELGTNAPGEIAALASIVEPDVAVITSIGEAHLEGLGDVARVAREKASLLSFVRPGGLAVVNTDRPEIEAFLHPGERVRLKTIGRNAEADVVARALESSVSGTAVELNGSKRFEVVLPGAHHAVNVAAVVTVAEYFAVAPEQIRERLRSFKPQSGRAEVIRLGSTTVIDDVYNANPTSMDAAIDSLARERAPRRVMILGDMFELGPGGDALHARAVARACTRGVDVVVAVGPEFTKAVARRAGDGGQRFFCFGEASLAALAVPALVRAGDCVWVKGSRAMGLETVVDGLRRARTPQAAVA